MPEPTEPRPEGLPETMKPEDVPDDLADNAVDAWHEAPRNEHGLVILDDHMRYVLAAVLPAHAAQVRERVAAETRAAAQAIEDSRGETRDPLAEEIWQTCRQEFYATCDDPRTIAAVAYRHIAHRIEEAR